MKPRDLIIVGAVVLLAGFAAADAIRGRAGEHSSAPTPTFGKQTTPARLPGPQPQASAPRGWPQGSLRGTLVFTDARDCRIRVIGLAAGVERPEARFGGNCQLWAPPVGQRVAYGLGPASADAFSPFRVADLEHPTRELGGFRALFGVVIWSPDGQRVAWCGRRHTGFDLEVGGAARRVPRCPIAYTPDDRVAWTIGNRLYVEGRAVLRANGGITFAHYGTDGSLVIVEDGKRMLRYDAKGRLDGTAPVPEGRTPILSPRNCAALFKPFQRVGTIRFVKLPCYRARSPGKLFGRDGAWSPDGMWIAVAGPRAISFHPVAAFRPPISWPASAVQLAWRVR